MPCPILAEGAATAEGCLMSGNLNWGLSAAKCEWVLRRHQLSPIAMTTSVIARSSQILSISSIRPRTGYRLRMVPDGTVSSSWPSTTNSFDISIASNRTDAWLAEPIINSFLKIGFEAPLTRKCGYSIEQGLST